MWSNLMRFSAGSLMGLALATGLIFEPAPASAQYGTGTGLGVWAHGGWSYGSFYYYPQLGFGQSGVYSWYYGRPAIAPFPYRNYGDIPFSRITTYRGILDTDASGSQYHPFQGTSLAEAATVLGDAWMYGYHQGSRDERRSGAIVKLRIEPTETALFLDGNPIGSAGQFSRRGADLRLPPGKYFLEAALDGYTVLGEELELKGGQTLEMARQLQKSDTRFPDLTALPDEAHPATPTRPTGILLLSGSPTDARVLLDGRFLCYASMLADNRFLHRIPAGPHTLEVSKVGYHTVREEIAISPLRPVEKKIVLERD